MANHADNAQVKSQAKGSTGKKVAIARQLGEHGYDLADLVALIGQFGEQGFAC